MKGDCMKREKTKGEIVKEDEEERPRHPASPNL